MMPANAYVHVAGERRKMEYDKFKEELTMAMKKLLESEYPDYELTTAQCVKHGQDKDAIFIKEKETSDGIGRGAALYADEMYSDARIQMRFDEPEKVIEEMAAVAIRTVTEHIQSAEVSKDYFEKDYVLDNVTMNLVNAELYEKTLDEAPHMSIGDMALMYNVVIKEEESRIMHFPVTNDVAENIGVDLQQLHEKAMENTMARYPEVLTKIRDGEYAVTAEGGVCKASVFVYNGLLRKLATRLGGDLLIVPASTEGLIIVREGTVPVQDLTRYLVMENMQHERDEILSKTILRYDRNEARLDVCAGYGPRRW